MERGRCPIGSGMTKGQAGNDGKVNIVSAHNSQSPQRAARQSPGGLRRIPGKGSRRSCRGRDSLSGLLHKAYSSG